MTTFASLFTGFGGADVGALQAGLTPVWGIEFDQDIAAVASKNLEHPITVGDILGCDPLDYPRVDVLHASPPCPSYSVAKANGTETKLDIQLGKKVAEFFTVLRPRVASIENVYGYRKAKAFQIIVKALRQTGYHVRWWHLNSADYGVPQTRKRLIMAASRDFTPQRPPSTHQERGKHNGQLALFGDNLQPWVGWYEAIEDLIPSLPDSEFAPWQLERLPDELKTMRAFIASSNSVDGGGPARRDVSQPSVTVDTKTNGHLRAFIVGDEERQWGDAHRPAHTVRAGENGGAAPRAFVVPGGNANSFSFRDSSEPIRTVDSVNRVGNVPRAAVAGRTVQMTPRALARFQSFPDEYELPDSKTLACRGIGNAVSPLLAQRLYEHLTSALRTTTAAGRSEAA